LKNIKEYRQKELQWFLFANIILLLLTSKINLFDYLTDENKEIWKNISEIFTTAGISVFGYIITFILDSLLSSNIKDKIIYWWDNKPSHNIFSKIQTKNKDDRFTFQQAENKYTDIFNQLKENKNLPQTNLWYKIYSKHRQVTMIAVSHEDYLLSRDLCVQTLILVLIYAIICIIFKQTFIFSWTYILYLLAMYGVTNISTRNKAKRLVYNVLAYDINDEEKKNG
jgi:hypothetical protein